MAASFLIAAGVTVGSAAPAATETTNVTARAVVVRYDDLDLRDAAGVQAFYQRLEAAAKRVCGPLETQNLRSREARRACVATTLADTVAGFGNPELAAVHAQAERRARPAPRIATVPVIAGRTASQPTFR